MKRMKSLKSTYIKTVRFSRHLCSRITQFAWREYKQKNSPDICVVEPQLGMKRIILSMKHRENSNGWWTHTHTPVAIVRRVQNHNSPKPHVHFPLLLQEDIVHDTPCLVENQQLRFLQTLDTPAWSSGMPSPRMADCVDHENGVVSLFLGLCAWQSPSWS